MSENLHLKRALTPKIRDQEVLTHPLAYCTWITEYESVNGRHKYKTIHASDQVFWLKKVDETLLAKGVRLIPKYT